MKKRLFALLTAALCLVMGACSSSAPVTVDCGDFSIACPRGWRVKTAEEATDNGPLMQVFLPEVNGKASYIAVTMQDVSGLKAADFTEANAQALVDASAAASGMAFTLDACEQTTLGNKAGVIIRYSGMKGEDKVVITEQLIPEDTKLYRITYTRLNESDGALMDEVMASVSFK